MSDTSFIYDNGAAMTDGELIFYLRQKLARYEQAAREGMLEECSCFSGENCRAYSNCRLQPVARMSCAINDPVTPSGVKSTYQDAIGKINKLHAYATALQSEVDSNYQRIRDACDDAIAKTQAALATTCKKILRCDNCGDSYYDSGFSVGCPHCKLAGARASERERAIGAVALAIAAERRGQYVNAADAVDRALKDAP